MKLYSVTTLDYSSSYFVLMLGHIFSKYIEQQEPLRVVLPSILPKFTLKYCIWDVSDFWAP